MIKFIHRTSIFIVAVLLTCGSLMANSREYMCFVSISDSLHTTDTNSSLFSEEGDDLFQNNKESKRARKFTENMPDTLVDTKLTKRQKKRISRLMKKYNIDTTTHTIAYYDSLKIADPFEYVVDYMSRDRENFENMNMDSLSRSFFTDTLKVRHGATPEFNSYIATENVRKLDSLIRIRTIADRKFDRILNKRTDSLSVAASTFISAVVPGFAQIRNGDYWKLPILYAGTGAFVGLGIMKNKKTNIAKANYNNSILNNLSKRDIDILHKKYNTLRNEQLIYFAGAAVTYLYFIADGIYNFDSSSRTPVKAAMLGLFVPGGGQIYNKSYWKLPIYYGALAALGYVVSFNNNGYQRYNNAYNLVADGDDTTIDEFNGQYTGEALKQTRDAFRRMRDMSIFYTCGVYLLGVMEAYVDAQFKSYDISDDLSFKISPKFGTINAGIPTSNSLMLNTMIGVSVDFNLK